MACKLVRFSRLFAALMFALIESKLQPCGHDVNYLSPNSGCNLYQCSKKIFHLHCHTIVLMITKRVYRNDAVRRKVISQKAANCRLLV